jgi:hypothetical protein
MADLVLIRERYPSPKIRRRQFEEMEYPKRRLPDFDITFGLRSRIADSGKEQVERADPSILVCRILFNLGTSFCFNALAMGYWQMFLENMI